MLDPRANKTEYDEDSTMRDLDDRQTDKLFQAHHGARPLSAKVIEKRQTGILRPKNFRPTSAKKNTMSPIKRPETYLNSRIRPNVAGLEKERLYDENIALKMQINAYKADLTNTKTRLKQLERENKRQNEEIEEISTYDKTPAHKYIRLTNALRKTVKELKSDCKMKDDEINRLKKSVKISKITELEVESQTLKDECKRLKTIIEEFRKKNESPVLVLPDHKPKEVSSLKKEKIELEAQVRTLLEENRKVKEKLALVKGKVNEKEINKSLKVEVQKLKNIADGLQKENFEKEKNLKAEILQLRKKEEEIIMSLEKEQKYSAGLIKKLENFEKIIKSLQEKIEVNENLKNSSEKVEPSEVSLKPAQITPDQISDIFKHFYLSMQLHRLDIDRLADVLLSKLSHSESTLKYSDIPRMFPSPPFAFTTKTDMTLFFKFLCQSVNPEASFASEGKILKINPLVIIEKLKKHLPSWKVFDTEEESDFDNQLASLVRSRKEDLHRECSSYDSQNSGIIEMRSFKLALKDSKLIIQPRLFEYMTLLFYSHEYEIDKVPYKNFLKAYGESPESEVFIDEEKLQVIKSCLSQIAQSLIRQKLTVREVFKYKDSVIYPEDFVQGLETLGVNNLSRDTVMMVLDQLQYENEVESCVLLEEFEKIMESLGVALIQKQEKKSFVSLSSRGSSDKSSNFKKVSAMDTENYEYSEDSPGRYGISEISPFGSVSNAEFPGKSSPNINDISKIDLEKIKDESSDSENYEKMKKIDFSPDNVKKKENFSPKKQKLKESNFSSPGEGKTLEYSLTVAPQDKSINNDLPDSKLLKSGTDSRNNSSSDHDFSQFSEKSKGKKMNAEELEVKEDRYSSDYNSSDEEKSFKEVKRIVGDNHEDKEGHRKNSSSPVESYGQYAEYRKECLENEKINKKKEKEWKVETSYQEIPGFHFKQDLVKYGESHQEKDSLLLVQREKTESQENIFEQQKDSRVFVQRESFESLSLASKGKISSRSSYRSESLADKAQRKFFVEENTGNATFGEKFEKNEANRIQENWEKNLNDIKENNDLDIQGDDLKSTFKVPNKKISSSSSENSDISEKYLEKSKNYEKSSKHSEKSLKDSEKSLKQSEKSVKKSFKHSENSLKHSDKSLTHSEKSIKQSEKSEKHLGKSSKHSEKSEKSSKHLEKSLKHIQKSSESSEKSLKHSKKSLKQSEKSLKYSEKSLNQSDKSLKHSKKSSKYSEKSSDHSEKLLKQSEKSLNQSDKSSKHSKKSSKHSEKSSEHSEKSIKQSEKSLKNSEKSLKDMENFMKHSENPSIHSEKSLKDTEKSLKHSEKSLKHSEKSLKHSEKSFKHSEKSFNHSENSLKHLENPSMHSEKSLKHSEKPSIHSEKSEKHSENYFKHSENPSIHSEKSLKYSGKPSIHSEKSLKHSEKSFKHSEKSEKQSEKQSMHSEKSLKQSEKQSMHSEKSLKQSEKSLKHSEKLSKHSEKSLKHSEKQSIHSEKSFKKSEKSLKQSEKSLKQSEKSFKIPKESSKNSSIFSKKDQIDLMTGRLSSSSDSEESSKVKSSGLSKKSSKKSVLSSKSSKYSNEKSSTIQLLPQEKLKDDALESLRSKSDSSSSSSDSKSIKKSSKASKNSSKPSKQSKVSSKLSKKSSNSRKKQEKLKKNDSFHSKQPESSSSSEEGSDQGSSQRVFEPKNEENQYLVEKTSEKIKESRENEENLPEFEGYLMNNFPTLTKDEKNLSSVSSLNSSRSRPQISIKNSGKSEKKQEKKSKSSSSSSENQEKLEKIEDKNESSLKNNENQPVVFKSSFEGIKKSDFKEEQKIESWKASYDLHGNSEVEIEGNYYSQCGTPSLKLLEHSQEKNSQKLENHIKKSGEFGNVSENSSKSKKFLMKSENSSKRKEESSSSEKSSRKSKKSTSKSKLSSKEGEKYFEKDKKSSNISEKSLKLNEKHSARSENSSKNSEISSEKKAPVQEIDLSSLNNFKHEKSESKDSEPLGEPKLKTKSRRESNESSQSTPKTVFPATKFVQSLNESKNQSEKSFDLDNKDQKFEKPFLNNEIMSSKSNKSKEDDDSLKRLRGKASPIMINQDPPNPVLISVTDKERPLASPPTIDPQVFNKPAETETNLNEKNQNSPNHSPSSPSSSSESSSSSFEESRSKISEPKVAKEPTPPLNQAPDDHLRSNLKSEEKSLKSSKKSKSSNLSSSDSSDSDSSDEIQKIQEKSFKLQEKSLKNQTESPDFQSSAPLEVPENRFKSEQKEFSPNSSSSSSNSSKSRSGLEISPLSQKTIENPLKSTEKPSTNPELKDDKSLSFTPAEKKPLKQRSSSSDSESDSSSSAQLEVFESKSSESLSKFLDSESSESFS